MTHWNLARCLRKLDRADDAAKHRRRCWEIESAHDGAEASGTLQTAHALAKDLIAANKHDAALEVVNSALAAAAEATDEDEDRAKWVEKIQALATETP